MFKFYRKGTNDVHIIIPIINKFYRFIFKKKSRYFLRHSK